MHILNAQFTTGNHDSLVSASFQMNSAPCLPLLARAILRKVCFQVKFMVSIISRLLQVSRCGKMRDIHTPTYAMLRGSTPLGRATRWNCRGRPVASVGRHCLALPFFSIASMMLLAMCGPDAFSMRSITMELALSSCSALKRNSLFITFTLVVEVVLDMVILRLLFDYYD